MGKRSYAMFFGIFLELCKATIAGPSLIQYFTRKMAMFYMDFLPLMWTLVWFQYDRNPGDSFSRPGDRGIWLNSGSLPANPGDLTCMLWKMRVREIWQNHRCGAEWRQCNKQGRMEELDQQLYRRLQMTGQSRDEEELCSYVPNGAIPIWNLQTRSLSKVTTCELKLIYIKAQPMCTEANLYYQVRKNNVF